MEVGRMASHKSSQLHANVKKVVDEPLIDVTRRQINALERLNDKRGVDLMNAETETQHIVCHSSLQLRSN